MNNLIGKPPPPTVKLTPLEQLVYSDSKVTLGPDGKPLGLHCDINDLPAIIVELHQRVEHIYQEQLGLLGRIAMLEKDLEKSQILPRIKTNE